MSPWLGHLKAISLENDRRCTATHASLARNRGWNQRLRSGGRPGLYDANGAPIAGAVRPDLFGDAPDIGANASMTDAA